MCLTVRSWQHGESLSALCSLHPVLGNCQGVGLFSVLGSGWGITGVDAVLGGRYQGVAGLYKFPGSWQGVAELYSVLGSWQLAAGRELLSCVQYLAAGSELYLT
jgi:hypothetical protein